MRHTHVFSRKVAGCFDLDPDGISRIVLQRNIFRIDDFHGFPDCTRGDSQFGGFGPGLFQGVVAGNLIIVDQLLISTADF